MLAVRTPALRLPAGALAVVLVAAAVGGLAGLAVHRLVAAGAARASSPALYGQATWPVGSRAAAGFTLTDQDGRPVSLRGLHGQTVLIAFLGPACSGGCALAGELLGAAEQGLSGAQRPAVLIVSATAVSRRRAAALARDDDAAGWRWLSGAAAEVAAVRKAYGLPAGSDAGAVIYLVDRSGGLRVGIRLPFPPPFLADDLRRLAAT